MKIQHRWIVATSFIFVSGYVGQLQAGSVTAQGSVQAIDHIDDLGAEIELIDFNDGVGGNAIPSTQYQNVFEIFLGELGGTIFADAVVGNTQVATPSYNDDTTPFDGVIEGQPGFVNIAPHANGEMFIIVHPDRNFSRFALVFGVNPVSPNMRYITAFGKDGSLLGQVTWENPMGEKGFVGIQATEAIGALAIGSDDLWSFIPPAEFTPMGAAAGPVGPVENFRFAAACREDESDCDDQNVCTADSCDFVLGCSNEPIENCCTADEDCLAGEQCDLEQNVCVPDDTSETDTDSNSDSDSDSNSDGNSNSDSDSNSESDSGVSESESATATETESDSETAFDSNSFGDSEGLLDDDGCDCQGTRNPSPFGWLIVSLLVGQYAYSRKRRLVAAVTSLKP